ncbi:hypothetical protein GCM10010335_69660 [Streptomyces galbus]|uniref:hypothetical protein n=1 Tax=Streptomyces galbus TaxID=33898 RepID=UPI0019B32740|nr:hypothetical protein [Streptomyces galbus]GHD54790.1 hypothetical protein GCM10010335_69660 [Streptomyces galbus]
MLSVVTDDGSTQSGSLIDEIVREAWRKYKVRTTTEAIIGAITGTLEAPRTVLLGRYDVAGRLQYAGRSTTLSARLARALGDVLVRPAHVHRWEGGPSRRAGEHSARSTSSW